MTSTTFLVAFIQTGVVLAIAVTMLRLFRSQVGVRVSVARLALIASVALFALGSTITLRRSPVVPVQVPEEIVFSVPSQTSAEPLKSSQPVASSSVTPTPKSAAASEVAEALAPIPVYQTVSNVSVSQLVFTVYKLGLALALLPMAFGALWIFRNRRKCLKIESGSTFEALKDIAASQGMKAPALYAGREVYIPLQWTEDSCDDHQIAVLRHELAHIVSGDLGWKFAGRLACAALWFQPLAWIMFRHLCEASEEQCDLSVLRSGVENSAYAHTLLQIRESAKRATVPGLVIGAVGRESSLAKRLKQIMSADARRLKKASRMMLWTSSFGLVLLVSASAYVFGQAKKVELVDNAHGAFTGKIRLVDQARQPVMGAKAWLWSMSKDEKQHVIDLPVEGDAVVLTEKAIQGAERGTLLVETKDGMRDFKVLWPVLSRPSELVIAKSSSIRGKLKLPAGLSSPTRIQIKAMLREHQLEENRFEYIPFDSVPNQLKGTAIDTDGNFEFSSMPSGTTICLEVDDDRIAKDNMKLRVKIDGDGHSDLLEYSLKLGGTVEGQVLRNGVPFPGLPIAAQGQNNLHGANGWGECVTDTNGRYRLARLDPDTYNVAANIPAPQRADFTMVAKEGLTVKAGETKKEVNFDVIPGGIISGVVQDESGKPIPGGDVGIYGPAHPKSSAWVQGVIADAKGHLRTRVPAGLNEVYYMGPGEMSRPMTNIKVVDGMESKVQIVCLPNPTPQSDQRTSVVPIEVSTVKTLTMKCGAVLNLEMLAEKSTSGVTIWMPDGASGKPSGGIQKKADQLKTMKKGENGTYALIEVGNVPSDSSRFFFKCSQMMGSGTTNIDGKHFEVWVPVGKTRAGLDDLSLAIPISPAKLRYSGPAGKQVKKSGKGRETLVFGVPPDIADKDLLLKAKMSDGRDITIMGGVFKTKQVKNNSLYQAEMHPGQTVKSVEVWWREIEWVTCRGVHMKPI
jgi:beta-lactamase regulating signal transducer with metallopeptidase domain